MNLDLLNICCWIILFVQTSEKKVRLIGPICWIIRTFTAVIVSLNERKKHLLNMFFFSQVIPLLSFLYPQSFLSSDSLRQKRFSFLPELTFHACFHTSLLKRNKSVQIFAYQTDRKEKRKFCTTFNPITQLFLM